ncbi:MAG: N-acetyl sugar amidotransferase [Rubrivivax sp.]|nr:N-acetyl sugar amidotransferase [Rubrivivax sp.]
MATGDPLQICSSCIYDSRVPNIDFDVDGVCNYCHQVDKLKAQYGTGAAKGNDLLDAIFVDIKRTGRGKKYDCVIGVSGGTDSSYLLSLAVERGLRPLAAHYDNTWNSAIATQNIRRLTATLGVDLYTHVVDNKEVDDIKRSFLLAGVPEFDADTDIGFVQVLRTAAAKYSIKYILEGHSFVTEGISPVGGNYLDGAYVADIHRRYGRRRMRTFPNMPFWQFMKWALVYRQQFIRPLWYIDYSKEDAREYLQKHMGWEYYGGHHLENRASTFAHTVWLPQRFGIDYRNLSLAASVRRHVMDRDEAIECFGKPVVPDPELIAYVCKRVGFTPQELQACMDGPRRTFRDFRTYKKRFERLRPMFRLLANANLVPMSFYLKYCFPIKS